MNRILLILMIAAFVGCSEDNDNDVTEDPFFVADENVQQYVGTWAFASADCNNRPIEIKKGQELNQLIFDNIQGTVKNKRLNATNPIAEWIVTFSDSTEATVDYNGGQCLGTLKR